MNVAKKSIFRHRDLFRISWLLIPIGSFQYSNSTRTTDFGRNQFIGQVFECRLTIGMLKPALSKIFGRWFVLRKTWRWVMTGPIFSQIGIWRKYGRKTSTVAYVRAFVTYRVTLIVIDNRVRSEGRTVVAADRISGILGFWLKNGIVMIIDDVIICFEYRKRDKNINKC